MSVYAWAQKWGISGAAYAELETMLNPTKSVVADQSGMSESAVQQLIRVEAPKVGGSAWRNNTGAFKDEDGRWIRYGLGNDSKKLNEVWKPSDLIGITQCRATYVGQVFGVFTAVEVKEAGWKQRPSDKRAKGQANFMNTVTSMGGLAGFAQSVEDYRRIIGQ